MSDLLLFLKSINNISSTQDATKIKRLIYCMIHQINATGFALLDRTDTLVLSYDTSIFYKETDHNEFRFELYPNMREAEFFIQLGVLQANLHFVIPALFWRFDDKPWNVKQPAEIWHRHFPSVIELSVPSHKVSLYRLRYQYRVAGYIQ